MLERMWSKGNTPPLLVEVQICTVTMEISMAMSQKTENLYASRHSYTTLGHIPKGCTLTPQRHLFKMSITTLFIIGRIRKKSRCSSPKEWIKIWDTFTQWGTT